jgi:hypothetical protein
LCRDLRGEGLVDAAAARRLLDVDEPLWDLGRRSDRHPKVGAGRAIRFESGNGGNADARSILGRAGRELLVDAA